MSILQTFQTDYACIKSVFPANKRVLDIVNELFYCREKFSDLSPKKVEKVIHLFIWGAATNKYGESAFYCFDGARHVNMRG